jgi:drug/metabolite transporter (DMT)-like permease
MTAEEQPHADTRAGIACTMGSTVCFASLDTGVKYLSAFYPALEIAWARYVFQIVLLPFIIRGVRVRDLMRTKRPGLQIVRSMLLVGATLSFFTAVRTMPIADASAIGMVSPLLITMLAIPFLGEKVGARRWTAVAIGLVGALIIIRPGSGVFGVVALLPLTSAVCFAFYQITTRILAHIDPPVTTFFYSGVVGTLVLTAAMPFVWQTPDLEGWALMVALGLLGGGGHFLVIHSLRRAPASLLAPFSYIQLVWVTILGYVMFGDFPDHFTILGALVVVSSGVYVIYRESVVR